MNEDKILPALSVGLMRSPKPAVRVDQKDVENLLTLVAAGDLDKVEELVKQNPKLLLRSGKVTDCAGRTFPNITAFQYALWALDYHMWTRIQKYLPLSEQVEQFENLESKETGHGRHYDLRPLLDALLYHSVIVQNRGWEEGSDSEKREQSWDEDKNECLEDPLHYYQPGNIENHIYKLGKKDHWCKIVGGAQKTLPMHMVCEYRRDLIPYKNIPDFKVEVKRTTNVKKYDNNKYVEANWFAPDLQEALGKNGAFCYEDNLGLRLEDGSHYSDDSDCDSYGCKLLGARDFGIIESLLDKCMSELEELRVKLQDIPIPEDIPIPGLGIL